VNLLVHCTKQIRWICRTYNERRNVWEQQNTLRIKVTKMFDPHQSATGRRGAAHSVLYHVNPILCIACYNDLSCTGHPFDVRDVTAFSVNITWHRSDNFTKEIKLKSKSQTHRCNNQIRLCTTIQITPSNCLTVPAEVHNALTAVTIVHIGNTAELISKCAICWLRVM
jgi:hypothetical protein